MKKIYIFLIIILIYSNILAQSPFYRQYFFDPTLLNPAICAKYEAPSVKMTVTDQWLNMPYRPQLISLTYNHQFLKQHMGFNAASLDNKYGTISNIGLKATYYYYTKLNIKGDFISYGVYTSLMQHRFNLLNDTTSLDPVLVKENFSYLIPDLGIGIYYKKKFVTFSLSIDNLLPFKNQAIYKTSEPLPSRTYFLLIESNITNEIKTFTFIPSILFTMDERLNKEININSKFVFKQSFWLGFSYRDALIFQPFSTHNLIAIIGFKFFKKLNIMYAYELNVGSSGSILGGSQHISIGYDFIKQRQKIPMYY